MKTAATGLIALISSTALLTLVGPAIVQAQDKTLDKPPAAQTGITQAAAEIGLEFEGSRELNRTTLKETEYTGDCPGLDVALQSARFFSSQTPTGEKRRVVIRNVTRGMGETPFTNREYDKGRSSEPTQMEFGTEHSKKRFRVMAGTNEFEYEVLERKKPIMTGRFTATIERNLVKIERNAQWYDEQACANSAVDKNVCADIRDQKQFRCPTGQVLKSEMRDTNRYYRTTLSNPNKRSFSVQIDGERYHINPYGSIDLRMEHDFSVVYPVSHGSAETRSTSVKAGKRVKFEMTGEKNEIQLVDDRRP